MVKTTISIDNDLWTKFSVIVLKKYGVVKNEVIIQLIKNFVGTKEGYNE